MKVTRSLTELRTTIDAGLLHRGNLLQTIGEQLEHWNQLVCQLFLFVCVQFSLYDTTFVLILFFKK